MTFADQIPIHVRAGHPRDPQIAAWFDLRVNVLVHGLSLPEELRGQGTIEGGA
jgi:hypothetical protein